MDHFKMMEICNNILTQMNEDDEFKYFINNTDKDIFVTVKVETSQEHITTSDSLINIKCRIHGLAFDTFIIVKNNVEHSIDKEKALECYLNQENIHIKRKKLAEYIATIAANNEHWYEESKGSSTESVNFYYERYMRAYGLFDICKPYNANLYKIL